MADRGEKCDKCETKGSGNAGWKEREYRETSVDGEKMERGKIRQTGCECLSRYGSSVTQHR